MGIQVAIITSISPKPGFQLSEISLPLQMYINSSENSVPLAKQKPL